MVDIPVRRDHGARIDAGVSEIDVADETRLVFRVAHGMTDGRLPVPVPPQTADVRNPD
jgi:hypothetical protein